MKIIAAVVLALVLCVTVSACKEKTPDVQPTPTTTMAPVE